MPPRKLIAVLHRLAGRTGHRFNQALGLEAEARRRGMAPLLLIHAEADADVRAALPAALAVLHDPVFRRDWSFAQRTADFVAMLHSHLDGRVRRDDRVLMVIATQCEARASTVWLRELPARAKPWVLVLFLSDRWNRVDAAERERQLAELRELGDELRATPAADRRRLVFAGQTRGLAAELGEIVGTPFLVAPMAEAASGLEPAGGGPGGRTDRPDRPADSPARVAVLGGARREKGSHRVRAIAAACRRRVPLRFRLQIANETLSAEDLAELERAADDPGVEVLRGPLGQEEYARALQGSDLLLVPYDRLPYRQRASGVMSEAILCGLPVVAPRGTWMAEQIEAGRAAGVVYGAPDAELPGDGEVESTADAVARAVADLPRLAERARSLAAPWREMNSLAPFLDWLEGEIALRRGTAPGWRRLFSRSS